MKFATEVFLYCLNLAAVISFTMIGICFVISFTFVYLWLLYVFILFTVITYMANVFVCLLMRITWPAGYNPNRSNGRCRTQPGPGQTEV